jgi:hypothetical protein
MSTEPPHNSSPLIGIVTSSGRSLRLVRSLRATYGQHAHCYYLTDPVIPADDMVNRIELVVPPCGRLEQLGRFVVAWRIFGRRPPRLIVAMSSRRTFPLLCVCVIRRIPLLLIQVSRSGSAIWSVGTLRQLLGAWLIGCTQGGSSGGDAQVPVSEDDERMMWGLLAPRLELWIQDTL